MARQPGLGDHPQPGTKTPPRARDEGHRRGRGEGEDLPENSQREPPDTRKKVSMSLSGTQMGPARPPRPTAPQPQQKPRSRCRRVFLAPAPPPRPAPQRPASARGCGVLAGGGGRHGPALHRSPLPAPFQPCRGPGPGAPHAHSRVGTAEAPGGGGARLQSRPALSAPPNVTTRSSGETGRRGQHGRRA